MTGAEFQEARKRVGWSIRTAAERTGVSPATIDRWERSDGARITAIAVERLREAEEQAR